VPTAIGIRLDGAGGATPGPIPASTGSASGDEGSKALSLLNALSPSYGFCKSFGSFARFAGTAAALSVLIVVFINDDPVALKKRTQRASVVPL
jgi:hypothetical protein